MLNASPGADNLSLSQKINRMLDKKYTKGMMPEKPKAVEKNEDTYQKELKQEYSKCQSYQDK